MYHLQQYKTKLEVIIFKNKPKREKQVLYALPYKCKVKKYHGNWELSGSYQGLQEEEKRGNGERLIIEHYATVC